MAVSRRKAEATIILSFWFDSNGTARFYMNSGTCLVQHLHKTSPGRNLSSHSRYLTTSDIASAIFKSLNEVGCTVTSSPDGGWLHRVVPYLTRRLSDKICEETIETGASYHETVSLCCLPGLARSPKPGRGRTNAASTRASQALPTLSDLFPLL